MVLRPDGHFLGASTRDDDDTVALTSASQWLELLRAPAGSHFTLRGAGHSTGPIAHPRHGTVLRSQAASGKVELDGELATVDTRLSWMVVEQELNRRGRSFPVLPDYLHLTVGGTLSVGGVGFGSIEFGPQIHHVASLRLVTALGDAIECSPLAQSEIFHACLAGLGQFGWIHEATLHTIPRRPRTAASLHRAEDLRSFVRLIREVEHVAGDTAGLLFSAYASREGHVVEVGLPASSARLESVTKALCAVPGSALTGERAAGSYAGLVHREREAWLAKFPGQRAYWTDFVLNFEGMEALLAYEQELLGSERHAAHLGMTNVLAVRQSSTPRPFLLQPFAESGSGYDYAIGIYYNVPERDPDAARAAVETLALLGDRAATLGGRPYLYGLHPSQKLQAALRASPGYQAALRLKQTLDPRGRLGSGLFPEAEAGA
jgi:FAD/FMN-containing dehydrogenase